MSDLLGLICMQRFAKKKINTNPFGKYENTNLIDTRGVCLPVFAIHKMFLRQISQNVGRQKFALVTGNEMSVVRGGVVIAPYDNESNRKKPAYLIGAKGFNNRFTENHLFHIFTILIVS